MSTSNHTPIPLTGGVYVPLVTPFKTTQEQELDTEILKKHVVRIASSGCGIVLLGTNGEASHLLDSERRLAISAARSALDEAKLSKTPLIAGTGGGSLVHTLSLCKEAKEAGADACIVVTPGYFAQLGVSKSIESIKDFFVQVADGSPLPIMIYNFPACAGGIDMDSDLLEEIAQNKNIVGAKLTCANVGKGLRLASSAASTRTPFIVVPGFADILLPSMMAGMAGTIAGTGNLFPRLLMRLYTLIVSSMAAGSSASSSGDEAASAKAFQLLIKAQNLQEIVARADWAVSKGGIGGTKWALKEYYGLEMGDPRKPLPAVSEETKAMLKKELKAAFALERGLETEAGVQVAKE